MVVESDAGTISRINIYPIKSFPGVAVSSSRVLSSGALEWDRRLALVDPGGDFINFKRVPELHMIRADYQLDVPTVRIWTGDSITARTFNLVEERESLGDYLTCLLNRPVGIVDNPLAGFPDDTDADGPTVVSVATLECVANLFPDISLEQARWRFRTNIEIEGVPPFWEDRLFDGKLEPFPFQIGGVTFGGVKPCQRCSVPGRHPVTGEGIQAFATILAALRKAMMPEWTNQRRFDHFYRLATNTVVLDRGSEGVIRVGDSITLSSPLEQSPSPELQSTGS
ncbi:MAG: MOSC N-terminal beta barrel domain-containing protein [Planctomycetota bacterium]|nr:MOSC N-terminal beta barrel domain-containing protein [Planctomycetota bacterium]